MNAPPNGCVAFHWPIPPYFRLQAMADRPADGGCTLEFIDGAFRSGQLLGLRADRRALAMSWASAATPDFVDLARIRVLRLDTPLTLVVDAELAKRAGAQPAALAAPRSVKLQFSDGGRMEGQTRGFVKNADGLYLNLTGADREQTQACFVPAAQIANWQLGALLGEALQAQGHASPEVVQAALRWQAESRRERLGEYLTRRGLVSPAEVTRALERQRHEPSLQLGEFLLREGLITDPQLQRALAVQAGNRERRLGDILIEMGVVTEREVQVAMSEKLGIPLVNVRDFDIDPGALPLLNAATASAHRVLPLARSGNVLIVAVENPLATEVLQDVQFASGMSVVPVIADPVELKQRIAAEYGSQAAASESDSPYGDELAIRSEPLPNVEELVSQVAREAPAPVRAARVAEAAAADSALVRLVNKMIADAHEQNASDIHIESNPLNQRTRIRFRKDGDLEDYLELPPSFRNALVSRVKIMAGLDIAEHRHAQDGKIEFGRFGNRRLELRVAIVPTTNGLEDVVMRLLGGVEPLPLEALGFSGQDLSTIKQMVGHSYGLILVCGPTGSGKTTTLHSVLHHINRPDIKIWTAEDPIEITQPGLRQVQINAKIGWTFADAMRAFLRADPDVIMVGEMRDTETSKIAIEASLTGHLVFSTLHTNSAAESVVRLLDLGMDPFNFADALIGVLSQRLARRLCKHCKRPHAASEDELQSLAREYCENTALIAQDVLARWRQAAPDGKVLLHEAVGCPQCKNGYRGRLGIYELLSASPAVKELIRSHGSVPALVAAAQQAGMHSLRQDGIEKVLSGLVDLASARVAFS